MAAHSQEKTTDLKSFLQRISLESKYKCFLDIDPLQDVQESDASTLKLTVFEWRRLRREVESLRIQKDRSTSSNARPRYIT